MNNRVLILAAVALMLAVPVAVSVRASQPRSVFVPSNAMAPTLLVSSRIKVQQSPYSHISQVQRGDIIVHKKSGNLSGNLSGDRAEFVARVVGLPGDTVQTSGTDITINGRKLPHVLLGRSKAKSRFAPAVSTYQETLGKTTYRVQYGDNTVPSPAFKGIVPAGQIFYMGDNRDNSFDSRYSGAVPFPLIVGKHIP